MTTESASTESEFSGLLTEAGFQDIQVQRAYDGGVPGSEDGLVFVAIIPVGVDSECAAWRDQ
jgi:hypothetical protein